MLELKGEGAIYQRLDEEEGERRPWKTHSKLDKEVQQEKGRLH